MKRFGSCLLLARAVAVSFTAIAASATPQAPVALGSNATFAVLGGTTVTFTGGGTVTGNIGISPGAAFVAGVPAVTVNGTIYAGGPIAAQAQADLTTAINDAAGRQTPALVSGNLGGQTLTPGLYKSTSSLAVSSGDLTLDAQGDPNGVFIFQIASTLTLTSGRQVILTGGANPANIFWQVGSSATLGTTSVLHGNVLAGVSISVLTGATLDGRALAQGGAVSVDTGGGSSITIPVAPTRPTVTSTIPVNLATAVPTGSKLTANFSRAMDPTSITATTFTLQQGAAPVLGLVAYTGTTATFTPAAPLAPLTTFTATVTTGAKDTSGSTLASNYVWTFTTGLTPDIIPPTVTSTVPVNLAVDVPIGNKLSATFSEPMDPATINTATFILHQEAATITGLVTYSGNTATFTPTVALVPLGRFTADITTGAKDLAGNALVSTYEWTFSSGMIVDITPPTVTSTVPSNLSTNVPIGNKLSVTFSEAMDASTITTAVFTLQNGATPVPGTVTYSGTTATFTPAVALAPLTMLTATITTGAKDLAGNALASNYIWTFTTGATPDITPPTVTSTAPSNLSTNVPVGSKLTATFSEAIDPTTISNVSFTLQQGGTPVPGTVTYVGTTATFTPASMLAPLATFTATVTTAVKDLAGNALASNYVWTFTTGVAPDTTPPSVTSTTPSNLSVNVSPGSRLSATFSEAMDPATITIATFTLQQGGTPISGTITYAGTTATLFPFIALAPLTTFTATITTGAKDLAGNALVSNYVWTFTTGATPDVTPPTVTSTVPSNLSSSVPTGSKLSATFSEAMDPATITTATFTLQQGGTPVSGTVTYAGTTATFTPAVALSGVTTFTATITTGVKDLAGNALASNYAWTFTTGATPDVTAPTVTFTVPSNLSTSVPIGNKLSATFSEAMDPVTITTATFTLQQGGTPVSGTVTYAGTTATFTPAVVLAPLATFTATITTGAKDLAGNALVSNYVWTFTTGVTPDVTAPTVTSTVPSNLSSSVPTGNKLSATFSEAMDPATITTATFTLQQGGTPVSGTVTYAGTTATFTPAVTLSGLTTFTATITTGVKDLAGNALASNYVWTFTTGATPDITPPTVIFTVPSNQSITINVPIGSQLSATFSEPMDPSTITTATFILRQGGIPISGSVTYAGTTATFTPTNALTSLSTFTATITTGAKDLAGNSLVNPAVWTFITGATVDTTPPTVTSTVPDNLATNVSSGNLVSATFSEAIDPASINTATFTVQQGGLLVPGTVNYVGTTATFRPTSVFPPLTTFTATLTNGIRDLAGNALVTYVWTFTTAAISVTPPTGPTVISTVPTNQATDVPVGIKLSATFSTAMDPTTINTATFLLQQGSTPISGSVTYSGLTATFAPTASLAPLATCTATITVGARDLAGNALTSTYIWTFIPGAAPAPMISSGGTVNLASYIAPVAPGSIVAVFGNGLSIGQSNSDMSVALPTVLDQTSFLVGGKAAPIYFASPGQVNLQIPWEVAGQNQTSINATVAGSPSNAQVVNLVPFAPGIFSMNMLGTGQGAILIAPTPQLAGPGSPVLRNGYISIFCTGLGAVTNQPATGAPALADPLSVTLTMPTVTIGGINAAVTYSGLAPRLVGLYQVNAQVPAGVAPGNTVPVVLSIGGVTANVVTIAVQSQ